MYLTWMLEEMIGIYSTNPFCFRYNTDYNRTSDTLMLGVVGVGEIEFSAVGLDVI